MRGLRSYRVDAGEDHDAVSASIERDKIVIRETATLAGNCRLGPGDVPCELHVEATGYLKQACDGGCGP